MACRFAGTIPGPIVFGYLIDRSCILWQLTCTGGRGACAIYENSAMGVNLFRVMIVVKSASILFFFCASLSTKSEARATSTSQQRASTRGDNPPDKLVKYSVSVLNRSRKCLYFSCDMNGRCNDICMIWHGKLKYVAVLRGMTKCTEIMKRRKMRRRWLHSFHFIVQKNIFGQKDFQTSYNCNWFESTQSFQVFSS